MTNLPRQPVDHSGLIVKVGDKVRVLSLSGQWFDDLPAEERPLVESMIGEIFEVQEIDKYGQPRVRKRWPNEEEGTCQSHSIALEPSEMEFVSSTSA